MGLDVPLQGAGAVDRVIAAVDDGVLGRVGDNQFQLFVLQTFAQVGKKLPFVCAIAPERELNQLYYAKNFTIRKAKSKAICKIN